MAHISTFYIAVEATEATSNIKMYHPIIFLNDALDDLGKAQEHFFIHVKAINISLGLQILAFTSKKKNASSYSPCQHLIKSLAYNGQDWITHGLSCHFLAV